MEDRLSRSNFLVSIVVPLYNAEYSLARCINSLQNQSYTNIEIILVDDGSTDRTLSICDEFKRNDSRISVFSEKRSGASEARNLGIQYASGYWITFVDADDYVRQDFIEKMVSQAIRYDADLCIANAEYVLSDLSVTQMKPITEGVFKKCEMPSFAKKLYIPSLNPYLGDYFRAVWSKLYRLSIIKKYNIFFPSKIELGEDAIFLLYFFSHCQCITALNYYGYFYDISHSSVVRSYKINLLELQINEFESLLQALETSGFKNNNIYIAFWNRNFSVFKENLLKQRCGLFLFFKQLCHYFENRYVKNYLFRGGVKHLCLKTPLFPILAFLIASKTLLLARLRSE